MPKHGTRRRTVLALDLEGTLISNEFSQIPRPGLVEFLAACRALAPRLVMFTTVPEQRFRVVARNLVLSGDAPEWLPSVEVVAWSGPKKDLGLIDGADPVDVVIVDDDPERFAVPGQLEQWIQVSRFAPPYSDADTGLMDIMPALREALECPRCSR